ncbi:MAG: serine/threonine protein kinase [Phycisphaerae bacterium]|nr:serine/threonine protein kinase [Phycisphaerae bacterium]
MSTSHELHHRAIPVVNRVLELSRERQSVVVAEACGDDDELAGYVRSLLRERDNLSPTDDNVNVLELVTLSDGDDVLPERLGNYGIHGRLGAGGMGVVYLAEQANPRRLVALKVLRSRGMRRNILQREVETLARLRHPGIAQIYEAGIASTPEGPRPFFAMEFVSSTGDTQAAESAAAGRNLLDYASQSPTWMIRDRLEIVAQVCDAVDYAHKRGIIHRDLKPANILVDHLGQPKVIDFGIAMLAGREGGDALDAAAFAGTLPYMSPEQLSGDAGRIDLRSDVYAIGVVAYQILAGSLPFAGLTGETSTDVRILKQREATPLSEHAAKVGRDVEAIVAKAMAEVLEQRYQTAGDLGADLRRAITKKPVIARPNTLVYRTQCLIRRRPIITSASLIAVITIAAAIFSAYRQNAGARNALSLLLRGIEEVDPISSDGTPATLDKMVASISSELDELTALHPDFAGRIHVVLGSWLIRNGSGGADAISHYRKGAEYFEQQYGEMHKRTLGAKNNLGMALSKYGQPDEAVPIYTALIPLRERSGDTNGALVTRGNLAVALLRLGDLEGAMEQLDAVFQGFLALGNRYEALKARGWQTRVLMEAGYLAEAEAIQREVLQRAEAEKPVLSDISLAVLDQLTSNLIGQKKWAAAKVELARMMRVLDMHTAPDYKLRRVCLQRTVQVQSELGDTAGRNAARKDLDIWEAKYGSAQ